MQRVAESLGLDLYSCRCMFAKCLVKGYALSFPNYSSLSKKYNGGNLFYRGYWGNVQDIRECEMILTESSLKLWSAYESID